MGTAKRARVTVLQKSPGLTSSSATVGRRPTFRGRHGGWRRCECLHLVLFSLYLRAELHPQRTGVAAGEDVDHLLLEVIHLVAHLGVDALLVHLPRAVDVLLQARVDVALAAALLDLLLVVELDLGDEEAGEAPRLLVEARVLLGLLAVAGGRVLGAAEGPTRTLEVGRRLHLGAAAAAEDRRRARRRCRRGR